MKSAREDRAAGQADTIAGRILEAFAKLTGNRSAGAKGASLFYATFPDGKRMYRDIARPKGQS